MMLFALTPDSTLPMNIAANLNLPIGRLTRKKLSNTETLVDIQESVRGKDVYLIFSNTKDFNNSVLDLLMVVEAMKNASVGSVTIVLPSFPYARYDCVTRVDRCPIARLVADMLESVDCDRVLTMDLHTPQVQGYFDIPVDNITAEPAFRDWIRELRLTDAVMVTPNPEGTKRVANFSESLGMQFAIVHIGGTSDTPTFSLVGNVQGRDCIIYDDIADLCFTIVETAAFLKKRGAKRVLCMASHGLFTKEGLQACIDSTIDKFMVTDTIDQRDNMSLYTELGTVDVAQLFSEAIRRIHNNEPLLRLFDL